MLILLPLGCGVRAQASTYPLWTLSPSAYTVNNPAQQGNTHSYWIENFQVRSGLTGNAVSFPTETATSYLIPLGQESFTAILAYAATDSETTDSVPSYNRARMQVLVDGVTAFETGMSRSTPPEQFTIPVTGGETLTIKTDSLLGWDRMYLLNPEFQSSSASFSYKYLPASGTGYVDVFPQSRQSMFNVFRPGETVAAHAYFGGSATSAKVTLEVAPESGATPITSSFTVALSSSSTFSSGAFNWTAPNVRGPSQVTLTETAGGKTYQTNFRIAIAPAVNLANASVSPFGVNIAPFGVAFATDGFASLWGAKWARIDVCWNLVEPSSGQYDFSGVDSLVNVYTQQSMPILAVIVDKHLPTWASTAGSAQYAAFKLFAQTVVSRYKGKIAAWDVINEPDHMYDAIGGTGNADLQWFSNLLAGVHAGYSSARAVCCSTGSTGDFLAYDKRIFDDGLLPSINTVSMHPYMRNNVAPEMNDGAYSFPAMVNALYALISKYGTQKPIWATEGNYIIGTASQSGVTAPGMSEHTQAEYDVRTNILAYSLGVHYFLASPFFNTQTTYLHLDTLSAYANMASFFTNTVWMKPLSSGTNGIYAIVAQSGSSLTGALWTTQPSAEIKLNGVSGVEFFDFYGNPISESTQNIPLSAAPIYFTASSFSAPSVTLVQEVQNPAWKSMQALSTWSRSSGTKYQQQGATNLTITSPVNNFSAQLWSSSLPVSENSCYVFDVSAMALQGGFAWGVQDGSSGLWIGTPANVYADGVTQTYDVQYRFQSGSSTSVRLAITGWNTPVAAVTGLEVLTQPQYRLCNGAGN